MVNQSSRNLYEFKKALKELSAKRGDGEELVSLYVPPFMKSADVLRRLDAEEISEVECEDTRLNVALAVEEIRKTIGLCDDVSGLAFFCGMLAEGGYGPERIESYVLKPPREIMTYAFECGGEFMLEPLKSMVRGCEGYIFVALDCFEASVASLKGERIEVLAHITSDETGGFLDTLGDCIACEVFSSIDEIEGIVIAGPDGTKEEFALGDYLPGRLKAMILAVEDVSCAGDFGLREVISRSCDVLSISDVIHEKKAVQSFLGRFSEGCGMAVCGDAEVIYDLSVGAVETLLLSDDFKAIRKRLLCPDCGFEREFSIKAESEMRCPCCGQILSEVESFDLVDFFIKRAEEMGSDVEFISRQTEEGMMLSSTFGGVAAILRYPVCADSDYFF